MRIILKMSSFSSHFVVTKLRVGRPEIPGSMLVKCGFFFSTASVQTGKMEVQPHVFLTSSPN
jgi:hypothetical protein